MVVNNGIYFIPKPFHFLGAILHCYVSLNSFTLNGYYNIFYWFNWCQNIFHILWGILKLTRASLLHTP